MRAFLVAAVPFAIALSAAAQAQSAQPAIGFPPYAFAQAWTALPTGRFQSGLPTTAPMRVHPGRSLPVEDAKSTRLIDEAFASAADRETPRQIALNEMMAPWPTEQRTAFQTLREAEAAYAVGDARHAQQFAALVRRVVDGTGRSAAVDGSASATLDTAYATALSREDDVARAKTEASEKAFVAYRDAFASFADGQSLGTGMNVAAELDRERAADLSAERR